MVKMMSQQELKNLGISPSLARYMAQLPKDESLEDITLPEFLILELMHHITQKRRFGGDYVLFGARASALGDVCEAGAALAHRTSADPIELMRLSLPRAGGNVTGLWDTFSRSSTKLLELYRSRLDADPDSLSMMVIVNSYLEQGVHPVADSKATVRLANRKIQLEGNMTDLVANAIMHFNRGIVFAINHSDVYTKMLETWDEVVGRKDDVNHDNPFDVSGLPSSRQQSEKYVESARLWAQLCRPDLLHLVECAP